eukprot:TRINITY_DN35815_c0_g1_i1.p1 TRINITY_DN35815_c0_g1~~TRINITY_DN35815_c0_g1_i1.p1  ORF type:complete len:562 (+),score=128.80 TRINITY_DN35815_c0_g1_i1:45-1688(+)
MGTGVEWRQWSCVGDECPLRRASRLWAASLASRLHKARQRGSSFSAVPSEVVVEIISFLGPTDLKLVPQINAAFRALHDEWHDPLWHRFFFKVRTADWQGRHCYPRAGDAQGTWYMAGAGAGTRPPVTIGTHLGRAAAWVRGARRWMEPVTAEDTPPPGPVIRWKVDLAGRPLWLGHSNGLLTAAFTRSAGRVSWHVGHAAPLAVPTERTCHTAALCNDTMVCLGGMPESSTISHAIEELWLLDMQTWRWYWVRNAEVPALTEHTAAVWRGCVVIFGGYYRDEGRRSDVYLVEPACTRRAVRKLSISGEAPPARSSHSAVTIADRMWVFGGWDGTMTKNDLWYLDLFARTWHCVHGDDQELLCPSRRRAHTSFAFRGRVYVCAGTARNEEEEPADQDCPTSHIHYFCTHSMAWTRCAVMGDRPCPRSRCRGSISGQYFYLMGGMRRGEVPEYFGDIHMLCCHGLMWRRLRTWVGFGVAQHSVVIWRDKLVCFAGFKCSTNGALRQGDDARDHDYLEEMERAGTVSNDVHVFQLAKRGRAGSGRRLSK